MSEIKIKIEGEGITFEDKIERSLVPQIIGLCVAQHEKNSKAVFEDPFNFFDGTKTSSKKRESVAEYLQRRNPKRNPDKILALAGYIKDVQKKDHFFSEEIKSLFRQARESLPANFTRDFNWVIASGWIDEDPDKENAYFITTTGIKTLEGGFPEELVEKSRNKSYGKKKFNNSTKKK